MKWISAFIITIVFSALCFKAGKESPFQFVENEQGVGLTENGQNVFFYQKAPVPVTTGEETKEVHRFNHYFHPLYNLAGEVITEAQPKNDKWHPHHRGIFWGWHQIGISNKQIADSWTMKDFVYDVKKITTQTENDQAVLILDVDWRSKSAGPEAFVTEHTVVTVYATKDNKRLIDFEISLKANRPDVTIAGSKDTIKGYGGFSVRIKLADSMLFRGQRGILIPITGQLNAGPWVDFSTPLLKGPDRYGLAIFCHPSIPNFPSPWLLRKKGSMQNPAFPGWEKYTIPSDTVLTLRYRLVIHAGNAGITEINNWYDEYKRN